MRTITFVRENITVQVPQDTTVMEAARTAGIPLDTPCAGQGTCGKCLVRVKTGDTETIVRACQTNVQENMSVDTHIRQ